MYFGGCSVLRPTSSLLNDAFGLDSTDQLKKEMVSSFYPYSLTMHL